MGKRILVTATTFPRWEGDTEPAFVYFLSRLLAKKGHKIINLVPHHPGAKKYEERDGMKIYRLRYFFEKHQKLCYDGGILENLKRSNLARIQVPFLFISEFLYIIKIIKKEKIDFIHAHWILPNGFIAAIVKKLYGVPFLSTAHAGDIFPLKKNILKNFARFTIKNSYYTTVNSNFTKNCILELFNTKDIELIPMGVNLKDFSPKKKDTKLRKKYGVKGNFILFVGRLAKKKGVEYLIRAMPIILKKLSESKLIIIGDGPEMKKLTGLTKSLNLEDSVVFIGKMRNKDLPKFYATADIFIGPSVITEEGDTEGLGITFLEAMASGTCVIGSNVGGIPDIIKQNKTGILVEQKNPNQLAEAAVNLLKNKKLQKKLIKNAIKHIKNTYSWDIVSSKFSRIYAKVG